MPDGGDIVSFESLIINNGNINSNPQLATKILDYLSAISVDGYISAELIIQSIYELAPTDQDAVDAVSELIEALQASGLLLSIASNGGGTIANISVDENTLDITTVMAIDPQDDIVFYSIVGGADASLFQIDPTTGALSFLVAADYENPLDSGLDNNYEVVVQALDSVSGQTDAQTIFVSVANVVEVPPNAPLIIGNTAIGRLDIAGSVQTSGDLQIPDGAISGETINVVDGVVGNQAGSNGTMTISGPNAELNVTGGALTVGNEGTGTLRVSAGGTITVDNGNQDLNTFIDYCDLIVGASPTGVGTLEISGTGTTVKTVGVDNTTRIGFNGGEGTLLVEDGGVLETLFFDIARGDGSTGRTVITGSGSTVIVSSETGQFSEPYSQDAGFARVGRGQGANGSLEILDGGRLEIRAGTTANTTGTRAGIQLGRDGAHGEVIVDGAGSVLSLTQSILSPNYGGPNISVGRGGTLGGSGAMTISNSGLVELTGEKGFMSVGLRGIGNGEVNILSGGQLEFAGNGFTLGYSTGSTGSMLVSGEGSKAHFDGIYGAFVSVGNAGTGEFNIMNGGQMDFDGSSFVLGLLTGATGSMLISGEGSGANFNSTGNLAVGVSGTGELIIADGGMLDIHQGSGAFLIGDLAGSNGSVIVDGVGSQLNVDAFYGLFVGNEGNGSLAITNGGIVTFSSCLCTGLLIGLRDSARGEVLVSGAGSILDASNNAINVGLQGAGSLIVNDGGLVKTHVLSLGENGMISGDGTIQMVADDFGVVDRFDARGLIAPGDGIGTLSFLGEVRFEGAGNPTLEIEIGGTANHDVFDVSESVSVSDSTLHLIFVDGFAPIAGDTFQFVTAGGGATGDFGALIVEGLSTDVSLEPITADSTGVSATFLEDSVAEANATLFIGGSKAEIIDGGAGNDLLTGGDGADTFVFSTGLGTDVVTDFNATNDNEKIDLAAVINITDFADLSADHMSQVLSDVVIADGANTITLLGVTLNDLGVEDFLF